MKKKGIGNNSIAAYAHCSVESRLMSTSVAVCNVEELLSCQANFHVIVKVEEKNANSIEITGHLGVRDFTSIFHCANYELPDSMPATILDRCECLRVFSRGRGEVKNSLLTGRNFNADIERLSSVCTGTVDFDLSRVC